MEKELNDLTNEELWQLFPVILEEHNGAWPSDYQSEKELLSHTLDMEKIVSVNHIGSTAIPGIKAKPTIDILIEIADDYNKDKLIAAMQSAGYLCSPQPQKPAPHLMFLKGYTLQGFAAKVYHTHIRYRGDWDELYFKDYLIVHPEAAKAYEELKISLLEKFRNDRDAYTDSKGDFIKGIVEKARKE